MNFLKKENFKKRLISGIIIVAATVSTLLTENASYFRAMFVILCTIACLEIFYSESFLFGAPIYPATIVEFEYALFILAAVSVFTIFTVKDIVCILIGAAGTDSIAYFTGNACKGKIFYKRPFPVISPNKTWEGLIGGYIGGAFCVMLVMAFYESPCDLQNVSIILGIPLVTIFGDLTGSITKRALQVKDSNERLLQFGPKIFKPIEAVMAGHGGYFDRLDSTALVSCFMLFMRLSNT